MNKERFMYKLIRKLYRIFIKPEYYYLLKRQHNRRIEKSIAQIKRLKKSSEGKRCFIVGNGPSLLVSDLEKLNDEICFGSHRIYEIYDKTTWRPTYYCAQDSRLIKKSAKDISKMQIQNKFIGLEELTLYPKINDAIYLNMIFEDFYPKLPNFSEDVSSCFYQGYTVTYMCLQMAVYMGFKEIYLLGVDHNYSVSRNPDGTISKQNVLDHFSENDKITNVPELYKSTLAYQAAKEYAEAHGIKIYNATRGGKLEVFERINFEEIFH